MVLVVAISVGGSRIAVTGRQKLKKYLVFNPAMKPSAIAAFTDLAAARFPRSRVRVTWQSCLAIRFHMFGEPSYQNRAIVLCSAVRRVLNCSPMAFTSSKSWVYWLLCE